MRELEAGRAHEAGRDVSAGSPPSVRPVPEFELSSDMLFFLSVDAFVHD